MSELGPSSYDKPHSADSPGRNADMPFGNNEINGVDPLGRKSEPKPPRNPIGDDLESGYEPSLTPEQIEKEFQEYEQAGLRGYGYEDSDLDHEHLEKATAEVKRSIQEIDTTEAIIAEHTGKHDQELADSVDDYLVDRAEHAMGIDASDKADIVETTLIEGALEVTGDRPEAKENPIKRLEEDGNDKAVTEGVRKLYEEGATLPNGESAAEVVATTVMSLEMQNEKYDTDSKEAGWDSPQRAQKLVESYITPDSKVLDIGIGTGQAISGYAEKGATVIGLDHDASMLDAAESIVGEHGSLRQRDINKDLAIFDLQESIDVAQAIGVLEFAEDLPNVLKQVHESLKTDGVFVFTSELIDEAHPNKSQFEDIGLTVHRHSVDEIKELLEKTGYTLLSQETYDGYEREDGAVPYGIFLAQKRETAGVTSEVPTDPLDTALNAYRDGASKDEVQERSGINPKEFAEYIRSLPDEQREDYSTKRREGLFQREAKAKLETSNPELFEGRVSQEIEAILHDAGYDSYAVGFNQHDAISDWTEATKYLDETGGVELGIYNPDQRFLLHDKDHPMEDYPMGYYTSRQGRFVYAFPVESTAENAPRNAVALQDGIPNDTFINNSEGEEVANAKYCVGFIDGDQVFHLNEKFMAKTETEETANPYERLTAEQLSAVRDNIADSIVQGIRKYDPAEVTRASANLAAIQREIETRSPESRPAYQRGEVAGEVTYVTEPEQAVIQKIVAELQKIDGAPDIARKLYGGLEIPPPNEQDQEARLQAMEMQSLLANVSREIREVTGSEFSESTNPYASMKNDELATTVDRLKQTIQERTAQGLDTTDFRDRLALAGRVIKGRN